VGKGREESGEQRTENREQLLLLHPDAGRISRGKRKRREWRTENSYCFCILTQEGSRGEKEEKSVERSESLLRLRTI
jgi:hypothetical protein